LSEYRSNSAIDEYYVPKSNAPCARKIKPKLGAILIKFGTYYPE